MKDPRCSSYLVEESQVFELFMSSRHRSLRSATPTQQFSENRIHQARALQKLPPFLSVSSCVTPKPPNEAICLNFLNSSADFIQNRLLAPPPQHEGARAVKVEAAEAPFVGLGRDVLRGAGGAVGTGWGVFFLFFFSRHSVWSRVRRRHRSIINEVILSVVPPFMAVCKICCKTSGLPGVKSLGAVFPLLSRELFPRVMHRDML